ncbi:hypothetical protein GCM10028864_60140 [Microlunatus parietis]
MRNLAVRQRTGNATVVRVRPETVAEFGTWRIVVPTVRVVESHLVLVRSVGRVDSLNEREAADLIDAYRAATSVLHRIFGSSGFMISFSVLWQPDSEGIGEPDPVPGAGCAIHVFGRRPGELISPVRAMALPRRVRLPARPDPELVERLRHELSLPPEPLTIEAPEGNLCDGCTGSVLTDQERWRSRDVRVIRPRRVLIDPHVLVLPLRHVVSLRDLEPSEVVSLSARLIESLAQFRLGSGSTGLSGFANDGIHARQETPHVHLHVYGRSATEPVNPYQRLAAYLSPNRP